MKNIWLTLQSSFTSFLIGKNKIKETLHKEILFFQSVTQRFFFVSDVLAV